jgi:cytochrome c551/c552/cytochrome c553
MSRCISLLLLLAAALPTAARDAYPGVGRPALAAEIAAWDIDVRADFRGLPKGSGSVKQGEAVWEAKCASCHGAFGESNAMFPPIAGGVQAQDLERGRAAALARGGEQRTTLMKLSQLSTLWDYINRAMPWNAPKTLSADEVYAVTAYILSFDKIVPEGFVLSDANMAEVQRRLPNRDGMTRAHGLWDVRGRPDVAAAACMKDCPMEGRIVSRMPDYARGDHGDLAAQNRLVGPVRGNPTLALAPPADRAADARSLAERSGCLACHAAKLRSIGPSLAEIAAKYRSDGGAEVRLAEKVRNGGQGTWGSIPMPPHAQLEDGQLRDLVRWVLTSD